LEATQLDYELVDGFEYFVVAQIVEMENILEIVVFEHQQTFQQ